MFEGLKRHLATYTFAGILDRIPGILRAIRTRLQVGGLIALIIGFLVWRMSAPPAFLIAYAITILALFGGYVIWVDSQKQQQENLQLKPAPPESQPNSITATNRKELDC